MKSIKALLVLLLFSVSANLDAQQKVYKVLNNPDGAPHVFRFWAGRTMYDDRNPQEFFLLGNLILQNNQSSNRDNFFYTYTTDESNQRFDALDSKLTNGLNHHMDSVVNALDLSFNRLVINNVDGIKQQLKLELAEEIKILVSQRVKDEMNKLKVDLQTQIDELKRKTNER